MRSTPAVTTIIGTPENDYLIGTEGPDRIDGLAGDDVILGLAGNDRLWGGPGRDLLLGQQGSDYLSGGPGDDIANGGPGADRLRGEEGDDILLGGEGRDWLKGHEGDDFLDGGRDDDLLDGGPGNDTLFGRAGNDLLIGGAGNDRLFGDGAPSLGLLETLVGPEPEPMTDPFWQSFALGRDVFVALTPGAPEITLHDVDTGAGIGSLQPPPGVAPFDFGTTLATAGNRILVGEPGADTVGEDAGRAHLYDSEGRFITTLESPEPARLAYFGLETAVSTEAIAVAELSLPGRKVHLFDPQTGAYRTSVEFPGGLDFQVTNISLAADGGTVAVALYYSSFGPVADYGAVYLYDAQTGALQQTLTTVTEGLYFAYDVAIAGDRVLVGSPNEADTGRAYLFDAISGDLLRTIDHPAPDPSYTALHPGNFGAAVALTGDRMVIGDQQSSVGGSPTGGTVFIFDAAGENLLEILTPINPDSGGGFGTEVAAVGETVAIGAPGAELGPVPGAIHLFRTEPETAGGDDVLYGGDGDDFLHGGGGADWLAGGRGNDVLTGGPGNDRFVFEKDWGRDVITDFEDGDRILFFRATVDDLAGLDLGEVDGDAVLTLDANSLTLRGIAADDVQSDWFFFV